MSLSGFFKYILYHVSMCLESTLTDKLHLEFLWWFCANNRLHFWRVHLQSTFYVWFRSWVAIKIFYYTLNFFQCDLLNVILWFFCEQFINFSFNCFFMRVVKVACFFVKISFFKDVWYLFVNEGVTVILFY